MNLTPAVLRYRECARHVWNYFFQPLEDGWHEYIDVEAALFRGLVLSQLDPAARSIHTDGYYDALAVVIVGSPRQLPAMYAEPTSGKWDMTEFNDASVELRFIEFFDFASYNDLHELKRVRARVVGPATHELIGKDVLLEVEYVRFESSGQARSQP